MLEKIFNVFYFYYVFIIISQNHFLEKGNMQCKMRLMLLIYV